MPLQQLQSLLQANPYNQNLQKAYVSTISNPAMYLGMNGMNGMSGLGMNPSSQFQWITPQQASAQQSSLQSAQPTQQPTSDQSYDSSFINNIPVVGGLFNLLGRTSAAGASGVSALLTDAAKGVGDLLGNHTSGSYINPLDAMQAFSNPNQAKYLGTDLETALGTQLDPTLKGILDTGSSVLLDPSTYLGGLGLAGKAGEAANAIGKATTGIDALGLAKKATTLPGKAIDALANMGADPGVISDIQTLSKGGQGLYDLGGAVKGYDASNAVKQFNQLDNYGLNLDKNGTVLNGQMGNLINQASDFAASNMKDINASLPKAAITDSIKEPMQTAGLVNPDGSFTNKKIQQTFNEVNNIIGNYQADKIGNINLGDAVQVAKDLGNKAASLLDSSNTAEQTMGRALMQAKSTLNDAIHNQAQPFLTNGSLLKPDQVQSIVTSLGLDPKKNANLIQDLSNARNYQDLNNILSTGYFGKALSNNVFKAKNGVDGVQIPLSRYDAMSMAANRAGQMAGNATDLLKSGVQKAAQGLQNAKANAANTVTAKAANSGIGQFLGNRKGAVGGALDRVFSSPQFLTNPDQTDQQTTSPSGDINALLGQNVLKHNQIVTQALAMGADSGTAKALADAQSPILTSDQTKSVQTLTNGLDTLNQIENQYNGLKSMKGPGGGDITNLLGNLGIDANAKAYNSIVNGLLATFKGAAGENGVLSDQDTKRIQDLMPQLNDPAETAKAKFKAIQQLLQSKIQNALSLIGNQ